MSYMPHIMTYLLELCSTYQSCPRGKTDLMGPHESSIIGSDVIDLVGVSVGPGVGHLVGDFVALLPVLASVDIVSVLSNSQTSLT